MTSSNTTSSTPSLDFERARFNMIEQQVRPWDVADAIVLGLLGSLPREDFVPDAYRALAFSDMDVPLTAPATEGQCMLAPKVQARMLQDVAVQPNDSVLHIGTGSGYMAGLLGKLGRQVLSLEINASLAERARTNLRNAGITNVDVRHADAAAHGFAACKEQGRYDVIVLSGSVAEVPEELTQLLKVGGRLSAIVGDEPIMRATLLTRVTDTALTSEQPWDYVAPRLKNFPEPTGFCF